MQEKILITSARINYMSSIINDVVKQLETVQDKHEVMFDLIDSHTDILEETLLSLEEIGENLANYMNDNDMVEQEDADLLEPMRKYSKL